MVQSTCRVIAGVGACVSIVVAFWVYRAIRDLQFVSHHNFLRDVYISNMWSLFAILALALIVTIGAIKLGTAIDGDATSYGIKTIETDRKIEELEKEIEVLRKKIEGLTDTSVS